MYNMSMYICIYVCYPLLERVYWYVVLLCYICYTEFKKEGKKSAKFELKKNIY